MMTMMTMTRPPDLDASTAHDCSPDSSHSTSWPVPLPLPAVGDRRRARPRRDRRVAARRPRAGASVTARPTAVVGVTRSLSGCVASRALLSFAVELWPPRVLVLVLASAAAGLSPRLRDAQRSALVPTSPQSFPPFESPVGRGVLRYKHLADSRLARRRGPFGQDHPGQDHPAPAG